MDTLSTTLLLTLPIPSGMIHGSNEKILHLNYCTIHAIQFDMQLGHSFYLSSLIC